MAIIHVYEMMCEMCEREYDTHRGGSPSDDDLPSITRLGWLPIDFGFKVATICPDCQVLITKLIAALQE